MIFCAAEESFQKSGAALAPFSSATRDRFASTSKVLLDLLELGLNCDQAIARIVHGGECSGVREAKV